MLDINRLFVTQHKLRYLDQLSQMVKFIREEGIWNEAALLEHARLYHPGRVSPLIQISRFPDGQDYIHDGHHRIITTWLGGRPFLLPEEYEITKWTYDEYLEINLPKGWMTPFDPRTHCRRPDLHEFKNSVRSMISEDVEALALAARSFQARSILPPKIEKYIRENLVTYCEPRLFNTIGEMASHLCLVV